MIMNFIFLTDIFCAGFEVFLSVTFFDIFWEKKKSLTVFRWLFYCLMVLVNVFLSTFYRNTGSSLLTVCTMGLLFLLTFFYDAKVFGRILFLSLLAGLFLVSELLSGTILMVITGKAISVLQRNSKDFLIGVLLSKSFVYLCIKWLETFFKRNKIKISAYFIIEITVFPMVSVLVILSYLFIPFETSDSQLVGFVCLVAILLLLANIITFYIIDRQSDYELKKQKLIFAEDQLKQQHQYYLSMYRKQEIIKKLSHDMKSRMLVLQIYLEEGKIKDAIDNLKNFTQKDIIPEPVIHTGYVAFDALLADKKDEIKAIGGNLKFKIHIESNTLKIEEMDLAILVGNLLNNAIEAVSKNRPGQKEIELFLDVQKKNILISTTNLIFENGDAKISRRFKKDSFWHGYGLLNIRAIIRKYHGDMNLQCENNIFIAEIMLLNT